MPEALELFYSYAHKDEALRERLDTHLAMLRHEGLIKQWYDRDISAGRLWAEEIDAHLKNARIILLLVNPNFLASDYCYGIEMQEAIKRQVAGEARVIPIILRPCDWETALFGKLQTLPQDAKPVTKWSNRDAAFTDIAKGIRNVVYELNGNIPTTTSQATQKKNRRYNMSTPKGMTCRNFSLASHDQILLYHNAEHIIMQLRHQVPTEENVLNPSFKVAVDLSPFEAIALASELLTIASPRIRAISTKTDGLELNTGDRVDVL